MENKYHYAAMIKSHANATTTWKLRHLLLLEFQLGKNVYKLLLLFMFWHFFSWREGIDYRPYGYMKFQRAIVFDISILGEKKVGKMNVWHSVNVIPDLEY